MPLSFFRECPDGGDKCKYRHALPPGFVLKSQKKKEEEDAKNQEISLEEFLEVEVSPLSQIPFPNARKTEPVDLDVQRHKLDPKKLTPLTKESFAEWKKTRLSKKEAESQALHSAKSATFAAGKSVGMSGRDLFTFNPDLGRGDSDDEEGDSDDGEDDEDWDMALLRVRTENERREKEVER